MLNDHDITQAMVSKDVLQQLVRLVNVKIMKTGTGDLSTLSFDGFNQFWVQLALYVYSKPPNDISHMPPIVSC